MKITEGHDECHVGKNKKLKETTNDNINVRNTSKLT